MRENRGPQPVPGSTSPGFLDLPRRSTKPRMTGRTHVLDVGLALPTVETVLGARADLIDLWKFGYGTAYVDADVAAKVALLRMHDVTPCTGGTLLEIAWLQNRAHACLAWAARVGFTCVEVSNGTVPMSTEDKRGLIKRAAMDFEVVSEVGSKDAAVPVEPAVWRDDMLGDLEAGAVLTLAEGRASGTVGLYRDDGSVRDGLVDVLLAGVGDRVVFEAPKAAQQAWFVRRLGVGANLANINVGAVLSVEALRLGLRADTVGVDDDTWHGPWR